MNFKFLDLILGKSENTESFDESTDNEYDEDIQTENAYIHPKNCSWRNLKKRLKWPFQFMKYLLLPRIGDVEGNEFTVACGESHIMNFEEHLFIADMGMFKAVFLSQECVT